MNIRGIYETSSENILCITNTFPLLILSLLIPLGAIITIFLYKRRKIQIMIVIILISIDLLLIFTGAVYVFNFMKQNNVSVIPSVRFFIPLVNLLMMMLAYRGIKKDEDLVRSYDRLR